uniref:Protein kinase domain-containing protein n=1 Tax=Trichuris muris TaxID=70415 RepID=A0A5S6Q9K1_TRIMR
MVILLCSNPRRGVLAVVNYDHRSNASYSNCKMGWMKTKGAGSKAKTDRGPSTPPSCGNCSLPFAVNCRFSKTFFSMPKRCGYCKKMTIGIGFACKNCRFRCHKRCVTSDNGDSYLKPKLCSLSRIPSGDEEMFGRLLNESEINSSDMDVFLENGLNQGKYGRLSEELAQQAASAWALPAKGLALRKGDMSPRRLLIPQEMIAPQFRQLRSNKSAAGGEPNALAQRQLHSQVFSHQLLKVKSLWEEGAQQAKGKTRSRSAQDRFDGSPNAAELACYEVFKPADQLSGDGLFHLRKREAVNSATCDDVFNSSNLISDLREWTISSKDLSFDECILDGRSNKIYRGRWHGAVMINTYKLEQTEENVARFLEEVSMLNNIRHENIVLFMGVVMEPPLLAVVTSVQNGDSLYNTLHVKGQVLSLFSKLSIARQVAQGMSYLHSRGIVLRSLTSRNIMLESKVKVSTIDFGVSLNKCSRWNKGSVRRGNLTYLSPELMKCLYVDPPDLLLSGVASKESDVYAFGTVLFELFASSYPHADLCAEQLIWLVCSGRNVLSPSLGIKLPLKSLISKCWSVAQQQRPPFSDVVQMLYQITILQSTESVSVPSKINLVGVDKNPVFAYCLSSCSAGGCATYFSLNSFNDGPHVAEIQIFHIKFVCNCLSRETERAPRFVLT